MSSRSLASAVAAAARATRQVVRRTPGGTYYLDLIWEQWGVVVEVDGIHHSWAQQVVGDALRRTRSC